MKFTLFAFVLGKRITTGRVSPGSVLQSKFNWFSFSNTVLIVTISTAAIARASKSKRDTGADQCLKGCPYVLDPVCGFDGTEYLRFGNECAMEVHNCEVGSQGRREFMRLLFILICPIANDVSCGSSSRF